MGNSALQRWPSQSLAAGSPALGGGGGSLFVAVSIATQVVYLLHRCSLCEVAPCKDVRCVPYSLPFKSPSCTHTHTHTHLIVILRHFKPIPTNCHPEKAFLVKDSCGNGGNKQASPGAMSKEPSGVKASRRKKEDSPSSSHILNWLTPPL